MPVGAGRRVPERLDGLERAVAETPEPGVVAADVDGAAVDVHAGGAPALERGDSLGVTGGCDAVELVGLGEDPDGGAVDGDRADALTFDEGRGPIRHVYAVAGGDDESSFGRRPVGRGGHGWSLRMGARTG